MIGRPAISWRTFGLALFIRVPCPAARMTALVALRSASSLIMGCWAPGSLSEAGVDSVCWVQRRPHEGRSAVRLRRARGGVLNGTLGESDAKVRRGEALRTR